MRSTLNLPISLMLAMLVNLLLFLAIQRLVQPDHKVIALPELVTMVDFIRFKKETLEPDILPEKPQPPIKPPPPPKTQAQPDKPKPQKIKLPSPEVKLPLAMTKGPSLQKYLKKPKPKTKVKAAPMPEPIPIIETETLVKQVDTVAEPKLEAKSESIAVSEPTIETDVVPTYRSNPKYPKRAMRAGINGVVTVEFTITPRGTVTDPVIISAKPPKLFDKAVLKSIKKWKFKPKLVNGKPVSRRARQEIVFNLK